MGQRLTREEFLEKIFSKKYEDLKNKELRYTRVVVPGKDVTLAHLIGTNNNPELYHQLALDIGVHAGENHTCESIGVIHIYPNEATIVAADVASKNGNVQVGQLDRFGGCVILLGDREDVKTAIKAVLDFFEHILDFHCCPFTED